MTLLRLAAGGLLSLAATAGAALAADPVAPAETKPWYAKLTPGKPAPPAPEPPTFATATPRPKAVGPLEATALLEAVKAEQAACDRRLEVCRKLREVALAQNDDALAQQAEELEQRATALFQQRVARFGGKSGWKAPTAQTASTAPAPFKVVTP